MTSEGINMTNRNSASIILWSAVVFSSNVIAKEIAIYRWVDENNVVHFSQHQPKDNKYTQLSTVSSYQASEKALQQGTNSTSTEDQLSQYEKDKAEELAKNEKIAQKNCQTAQLNEEMLLSMDKVLITDPEGVNRALSDNEKEVQLALSKKHINLYCTEEKSK
jgi:hypothetical protein